LDGRVPDPIVTRAERPQTQEQPEDEALLADSVGLALQVVLETLAPAERLAFVLHDLFGLPFEEIAPMVERTPAAARQLASRARRRVKGAEVSEIDVGRQRQVVDAFFAAARGGDLEALVAVLDPDVVLRADFGPRRPAASMVVQGALAVAHQARLGASPTAVLHPVLINGAAGVVVTRRGRPFAVMAFTVAGDRIIEIDVIGDPERAATLAAAVLE
jgi:RNA polymerase sigma-70 factor (ECF subfamily)